MSAGESGHGRGANWTPSPASGDLARGYSWEAFTDGNAAAVRHGAYSERAVDPLARLAHATLKEAAPWITAPAFSHSLAALSRVTAQVTLVDRYVTDVGPLDADGKPRAAVELQVRLERLAADLRSRLGLDPSSYAKIQADLAGAARDVGLEALRAEGEAILRARDLRLEGSGRDADDCAKEPE